MFPVKWKLLTIHLVKKDQVHTETKRGAKEKINRNTHNIDKPHARVEHVLTEWALGHRQIEANRKKKP